MNKIEKQIARAIFRANFGCKESLIEFVKDMPKEYEHIIEPQTLYPTNQFGGHGNRLTLVTEHIAVEESTAWYRDRAWGTYFYTSGILVQEDATLEEVSRAVKKNIYHQKEEVYTRRYQIREPGLGQPINSFHTIMAAKKELAYILIKNKGYYIYDQKTRRKIK